MIKIFIITVAVLGLGILGMSLRILIQKNGKFPVFQVGHNKDMKKMGIRCVKSEEISCHRKNLKKSDCISCGKPRLSDS